MFFLYVLKEEKKCPVNEVFENFIKPIDTSRFTADYGEDYKKVLKKIKKQSKYEKLYNRAIKKMRLLNGNKEYKSDSCLPNYSYDLAQPDTKAKDKGRRGSNARNMSSSVIEGKSLKKPK